MEHGERAVRECGEGAYHVGGLGDVTFDEGGPPREGGFDRLAGRAEEVFQDDDGAIVKAAQQGRANVPGAGQQRRHSAGILRRFPQRGPTG